MMKVTGVIRRIDELGRVVIPKEIRKRLRIREGDSLEIFVENNEFITLKKYSLFSGLEKNFEDICKTLTESLENTIMVVSNDEIIAGFGKSYCLFKDMKISIQLKKLLDERKQTIVDNDFKIIDKQDNFYSFCLSPIISSGDVLGAIIIISDKKELSKIDLDIITIISKIVGRQQEF